MDDNALKSDVSFRTAVFSVVSVILGLRNFRTEGRKRSHPTIVSESLVALVRGDIEENC